MIEIRKNPASLIKNTFLQAIDILSNDYKGSSLTDIFITVDVESGEVAFYDDEENRIAEIVVFDWVNKIGEISDDDIVSVLRKVTEEIDNEDMFSSLDLYKPFSVNYADENFIVIEELLLINEDMTIKVDNGLMDKLDRDFDDFLDKLLNE